MAQTAGHVQRKDKIFKVKPRKSKIWLLLELLGK